MWAKPIASSLLMVSMLFSSSHYKAGYVTDDVIAEFISAAIPSDAQQIDSSLTVNANCGDDSLLDKTNTIVHSFTLDNMVYTALDFSFIEKINTSKNDAFTITTNDYLWPLEAIRAELYVKGDMEDTWTYAGELDTLPGLDGLELYGSQINRREPYIRILLCFVSQQNPASGASGPAYVVTYNNAGVFTIPLWVFIPALSIVALIVIYILRRWRKGSRRPL